jgi:hypothetical protein
MTNDEAPMTKEARNPKTGSGELLPMVFVLRASPLFRHSSFVIRHSGSLLPFLLFLLAGCAAPQPHARADGRHFVFHQDSFAYANELVWRYEFDPASGKMTHVPQTPKPDYTHHCFVVARAARQFFDNVHFDPAAGCLDTNGYRDLIQKVMTQSPRHPLPPDKQIVIPGYSNLFEFSQAHEALLKSECGGAWQSYFQRGHWRMIFPLSTAHQQRMARQLATEIQTGEPRLVHVVRFPSLSINHALLLFDCKESDNGYEFSVYDPYDPEKPTTLTFNRSTGRFSLPRNGYFVGGRVDIYEIFHKWNY